LTGELDVRTFESILEAIPVEVSFVDTEDTVRYFNKNGDRVFPRPKGIIGRKVQNCHPKKSLARVEEILQGFKDGSLDQAEFWIDLNDRKIYIRYVPVHDQEGTYIGCLEVTQDVTRIRELEGEKRLLSEEPG
jgi:hypothetical protein